MFVLGKKYPELDMSELEAGVDAYMNGHDAKGHQQKEPTPDVETIPTGVLKKLLPLIKEVLKLYPVLIRLFR